MFFVISFESCFSRKPIFNPKQIDKKVKIPINYGSLLTQQPASLPVTSL